jgi:RNA polymerase sigma factor (sigma-70 family)
MTMNANQNEKDNTVPFNEKDLVDFASAVVAGRSDLTEHDREDAVQRLCEVALSCAARATEGRPVRTFQWRSMQGALLTFCRELHARENLERTVLNAPVKCEDGTVTFADTLTGSPAAAEVAADAEENAAVRQAVASLSGRQREVAERHLIAGETLAEIGQSWGVTTQRVQQIEVKASEALRHKLARFATVAA